MTYQLSRHILELCKYDSGMGLDKQTKGTEQRVQGETHLFMEIWFMKEIPLQIHMQNTDF